MEQYKRTALDKTSAESMLKPLIEFTMEVDKRLKYRDYLLDICSNNGILTVIEINTPLYLFGGIHLGVYFYMKDTIHTATTPIYHYVDSDDILEK